MEMSEQINELAVALANAQGEMTGAAKDSDNPFFKSKYADLASVMEACRGPLSRHGIAVIQAPSIEGNYVSVETRFVHVSGQWLRGTLSASVKDDAPQSIGSAITYLRRYALQSFAGVAPEDDDGEAATNRNGHEIPQGARDGSSRPRQIQQPSVTEHVATPAGAPSSPGHLGTLITKIDESTLKTGKPKWFVHFEDGNKASTIFANVASKAQQCQEGRIRVQPELKKTQWGYDLMGLFPVSASAPALPEVQLNADLAVHTEPLTDEDIPF